MDRFLLLAAILITAITKLQGAFHPGKKAWKNSWSMHGLTPRVTCFHTHPIKNKR